MSADATLVLAAVAAELTDLFPAIPVRVRKRLAENGKQLAGGWTEGFPLPCLVVSSDDPEAVDEYPTFEDVSVGYKITVEYAKAAFAAVPGGATPAEGAEDEDTRDKRAAIRARLYKPRLGALPNVIEVAHTGRTPYGATGGGKGVVSGQVFTFTTWENRPE